MRRTCKPGFGCLLLVFLFPSFSLAQKASSLAQKLPEVDVFGGYSYLREDTPTFGYANYSNLDGWIAAVTAPHLFEQLGVTASAGGNYASGLQVYNFLIGPQVSFERRRMRFYGNLLFGKAEAKVSVRQVSTDHVSSQDRAVATGGGAEMRLKHHIAVRLFDVSYMHSKDFGASQNNLRISTGLIYEFGKK